MFLENSRGARRRYWTSWIEDYTHDPFRRLPRQLARPNHLQLVQITVVNDFEYFRAELVDITANSSHRSMHDFLRLQF